MGCDIHKYIEFADWVSDDGPYWKNFASNGGDRNYVMFGVLAGVRCPEVKLFDPKGIPAGKLGFETSDSYWLSIAPDNHPDWADNDGYTSRERAESWVERGISIADRDDNGDLRRVSGPDWHSHSWLTLDEVEQAMAHYLEALRTHYAERDAKIPAEWAATVAAMKAFEASGAQTRLVFWFDN